MSAHFLGFWKGNTKVGIQPERPHQEKWHQEVSPSFQQLALITCTSVQVNKAKPQTRGSEWGEKLVLPVMFIQHQQYLDRRMLQFWALRPSITDSSLTLSLELSVSSMASVSFWKEHERNPSASNGDTQTWDAYFPSPLLFPHTMLTYTHGLSWADEAALGRWNRNKGYFLLNKGNKRSWPPACEKALFRRTKCFQVEVVKRA